MQNGEHYSETEKTHATESREREREIPMLILQAFGLLPREPQGVCMAQGKQEAVMFTNIRVWPLCTPDLKM